MENILEGFSLLGDTEKHINDLEDRKMETARTELSKEILKNENSLKGAL